MNKPVVVGASTDDRSTDLRAKIVGILSDTANGCISELGYFPSLLKKLHELEQANKQWKEENVRLFHDNRTLAQYTRHQEERFKNAPESIDKIALLEEQVKALSMQNLELKRVNETLVAGSSINCSDPAHQRLLAENHQLTILHHTAIRKIHHLQQAVQSNVSHDSSKFPKSSHQNIAPPGQDPRQHVPINQRAPHGYTPSHPPSVPIGTHQQIPASTPFQQNATQPTSSMPNLRTDPGFALPVMNVAIPNITRNVTPQTSPISPMTSVHPQMTRRKDSIQPRQSNIPISVRPTQAPASSVSHGALNSLQSPSLDNDHSRLGWVTFSPHLNRIPASQSAPIPAPKSLPSQQATNQALSPAVQDTYMPHTSPTSSVPRDFLSPSDSPSIKTPVSSTQETVPAGIVSSPWMAFDQFKREREDVGSDLLDMESAKKRIRLGEEDRTAEAGRVQGITIDDESDQEIEIDSDGLRSIASCISELMENIAENPECYMCRLCEIRYKTGVISKAPKPLIGVTQEQLVQHLTTEHADAWETLRRDV